MEETEQTSSKRNPKNKKAFIIAGIVLLVLAAGAVFGGRWWLQQREYEQQAEPEAVAETAEDAQNQVFEGDFDAAHETIDTALDNPRLSQQDKLELYVQQGAIYESQQNYDAALRNYRQAETLDIDSYGVALSIANLATLMKNKELALEYYKKALELFPENSDDPLNDQNRQYIEDWIAIWEAGGPEDGPEGGDG